ncbi:MAG TPA: hypothetical protein RMH26_24095, partial [Polyangiaceae bacterium LLY-WYZ-15_(1-7)]|nr:hypothetical protein [Polyangiaceae bacterium LLY-WYZ-15_(1-7)]
MDLSWGSRASASGHGALRVSSWPPRKADGGGVRPLRERGLLRAVGAAATESGRRTADGIPTEGRDQLETSTIFVTSGGEKSRAGGPA